MSVTEQLDKLKPKLIEAWLDRLEGAHVLMGNRDAAMSELMRWLDYLGPTADGDQSTAHELHKLVAFHARNLGAEGRPASAALMQILLLEDALEAVGQRGSEATEDRGSARSREPPKAAPLEAEDRTVLAPTLRELLRVVADAHALGASERARNRHHLEIRDFSPVVRLGEKSIMGFLLGNMDGDLIDAMMGRLLRETVRSGADVVVLDTFGAARDNDTFHRTVQAFQRSDGSPWSSPGFEIPRPRGRRSRRSGATWSASASKPTRTRRSPRSWAVNRASRFVGDFRRILIGPSYVDR
jgi:hypothetical protein